MLEQCRITCGWAFVDICLIWSHHYRYKNRKESGKFPMRVFLLLIDLLRIIAVSFCFQLTNCDTSANPLLSAFTDFPGIRIIVRDLSGKFCYDLKTLFGLEDMTRDLHQDGRLRHCHRMSFSVPVPNSSFSCPPPTQRLRLWKDNRRRRWTVYRIRVVGMNALIAPWKNWKATILRISSWM